MVICMFAVFDAKAGFFSNPFYEQNEGSAIRAFSDAVNDGSNPNNNWFKHPEDFSLFHLGQYDNHTGTFDMVLPKSIISAASLKSFGEVSLSKNGVNLVAN